ncbi:hypothetical protein ACFS5L_16005 [Streptomyces phyllanthi]|uniref:Uncharacterized protein n=1 Tax=Streptomyces phyllanthi TaxID=1803180 RepID=A0A5N8VYS2_9ACTN|nr:hypothetical protein [Streptomyces phyllanthi]MPY39972.1 hypothetical protein [Streptomyces phyllanthi]
MYGFGGRSGTLYANQGCTDIPDIAAARSASNNATSGQIITFYFDYDCQDVATWLNPGETDDGRLMAYLGPITYTSRPV